MFDFGLAELALIAVVAILVIGPKELPALMAQIGRVFKRLNYMRYALSSQFDEFMRQSGVEDIRQNVNFEALPADDNPVLAVHEKALAAKPKVKKKATAEVKTASTKKVKSNDAE